MLWLAWRQHRIQIVAMLGLSIAIAVAVVVIRGYAQRLYIDLGVETCVPLPNTNMNCAEPAQRWARELEPWRFLPFAVYVGPALVGSFIGGPLLAREFERGTHRLAWTQGIGRVRWAATKLGLLLVGALAAGWIVAAVGGQLRDGGAMRFYMISNGQSGVFVTFDLEGPALVSYVVFGLIAGAFFGTWSRRILTGMFVGLLAFSIVRVVVANELRPRYEPPVAVATASLYGRVGPGTPIGAWTLGSDAIDGQGRSVPPERVHALIAEFVRQPQPNLSGSVPGFNPEPYLAAHDVYQRVLYQPADRYWTFQWIEAAIFFALSGVLALLTLLLVRRRDA